MIEPAFKHKNKLQERYMGVIYDNRYKYYFDSNWKSYEIKIDPDDFYLVQAVSIRKGEVIGYLKASLNRSNQTVDSLSLMCFDQSANIQFGADVKRFIKHLFRVGNRKINFTVIVGNPIESSYDKLVNHLGGRIVGTKKKHSILADNKIYDEKEYEIFNKNWKPTLK